MIHSVTSLSCDTQATVAAPPHPHNALLELAASVASLGHWQIDLKRGQLYWSDEVYRIHGVTPNEYTPDVESAIDFYHPDDAARVSSMVDSAISDRRPFEFEFRLIRRDGTQRTVYSRALVQVDEDDNVASVFGVLQDVTDERNTRRELKEQVSRFNLTMAGSGVGLWDWQRATNEIFLSSRAARLTGMAERSTFASFMRTVIAPDRALVRDALDAHVERALPFDVQCRISAGSREIKWVRLRGQAALDGEGVAERMAGSIQDVSVSKRHEALRDAISALAAEEGPTCAERITSMLNLGRRFLALDFAFVVAADDEGVVITHTDDASEQVLRGARVPGNPVALQAAANAGDFVTERDAVLRSLVPQDSAGPGSTGDMIGYPLRIGRKPRAVLVFAGIAANGRIFGETARSVVKILAQVIGYEITCGNG